MRELYSLGGRQFRAAAVMTLEHDWYVMGRVREAGLDSLPMREGEPAEEYAYRMLTALETSPRIAELCAAGLVPVELPDEKWSPGVADEVALTIRAIVDDEEKAVVRRILLSWLIPFLQSGLARLTVSRSSSDGVAAGGSSQDTSRENALTSGSGAH